KHNHSRVACNDAVRYRPSLTSIAQTHSETTPVEHLPAPILFRQFAKPHIAVHRPKYLGAPDPAGEMPHASGRTARHRGCLSARIRSKLFPTAPLFLLAIPDAHGRVSRAWSMTT